MREICGSPDETQIVRVMNIFYDVIVPYIATPRHVTRFQNAISVTWPAIANEVNLADFIGLETLRLYEPGLFKAIHFERVKCAAVDSEVTQINTSALTYFCKTCRQFDMSWQNSPCSGFSRGWRRPAMWALGSSRWNSERRVCVETHFDTYFRSSLSDEALSSRQLGELIERANDPEFIRKTLRQAAMTERKGGRSMVPVYLDELTTHAARVQKPMVEPLLSALFEIHDEIDLEKDADKGFSSMANTSLRLHWLIRGLTKDRFSIGERTDLYLAATEQAALGWLVDSYLSQR